MAFVEQICNYGLPLTVFPYYVKNKYCFGPLRLVHGFRFALVREAQLRVLTVTISISQKITEGDILKRKFIGNFQFSY